MRRALTALLLAPPVVAACAAGPDGRTLAQLRGVEPDVTEVQIDDGLDQAILGYRKFLDEAPESALTPEAMRRLADLQLEKEYGVLGGAQPAELPAPEASARTAPAEAGSRVPTGTAGAAEAAESDADFERRATRPDSLVRPAADADVSLPGAAGAAPAGPLEAIALYDRILETYPDYEHNDQVLYQKARAYDELGRSDEAIAVIERLIAEHPGSAHIDEVEFRKAEYFFTRRLYLDAEEAYAAVTRMGPGSEYYELALYKLGWSLYKQELHEEALRQYVALLDYKVSIGYDFDHSQDEDDERRIADTFRVISLCLSNLGGPQAVADYFAANGARSYEDRIYSHLGEFYLEKLRYQDAAGAYRAFVELHPLHRMAPHFSMRVVEIYEAGGFPKLVLEAKKDFAATYGLQSEYWRHFDVADSPEVLRYLRTNLSDLANHYHALYQDPQLADDKPANFDEASRWYRAYLASFPQDPETPSVNHRLADLLLEHGDFGPAAQEYERTAYDYPEHEEASAAGYAAIYAHRQQQKLAAGPEADAARREAVASTLRFVDRFPQHEHASAVLGAAVDDLYAMKEYEKAIATGRRLIGGYPTAEPGIRRAAWAVVAHSAFELAAYPDAEDAYQRVLEMTPADDPSRAAVVDNLAAAIYEQGEQAKLADDPRTAADHFLRIRQVASTSSIRPAAEYDAAAALIRLEDWAGAAEVLEAFREAYPEHELYHEATKQLAFVYRQQGDLVRSAREYERVATEAGDPELRSEALLLAGELYEGSAAVDRALAVYLRYLAEFSEPLESSLETRFKVAGMYDAKGDVASYRDQLRQIVSLEAAAAGGRTPRTRYLAAQSALVLAEVLYQRFAELRLVQPFEPNLQEKQRRMQAALDAFGGLVDYEVADVTAAATFYMAEVYSDFSRALAESERPADLGPAELQDYELALEEEAYPFEERAIGVHEKNLELLASGVYSRWIDKSLARLAELVPGRYAKFEASSGWIASLETWTYEPPRSRELPADAIASDGAAQPETSPSQPERAAEAAVDAGGDAPAAIAPADFSDPPPGTEPTQAAPSGAAQDDTATTGVTDAAGR